MKIPNTADRSQWFGSLITLFFIMSECISHAGNIHNSNGNTNQIGEILVPLKSGKAGVVSYGLYCAESNWHNTPGLPKGGELILVLRNIGAKSINMKDVTVEDFSLEDSHGRQIKLYLWNSPRTMGYGDATIIHLVADNYADAVQPWTLHFKSKPEAHVPVNLSITYVYPS